MRKYLTMEIENFDNLKQNNITYGGRAGQKLGVIIDNTLKTNLDEI